MKKILIILFILFSINLIAEEDKKEQDKDVAEFVEKKKEEIKKEEQEKEKEIKSKILILPAVYTNSEDEFFIGGMTHYFKIDENYNETLPVRRMNLELISESKTRYSLDYSYNELFYKQNYNLEINANIGKYTTNFYGIGNDTKVAEEEEDRLSYTKYKKELELIATKVMGKFKIGPVLSIKDMEYFKRGSLAKQDEAKQVYNLYGNSDAENNDYYGSNDLLASGLGLSINYDTRDSIYDTKKGNFVDFKFLTYPESFNGDQGFSNLELDCRTYFEIFKNNILAAKYKLIDSYGDTPFYYLPSISGDDRMKGIVENRFIDNSFMMLQLEYRFPIFNNVSGALFTSVGDVAEEIGEFEFSDFKITGGFGLRMKIEDENNLSIGLDLAVNNLDDDNDNILFYFNLGQSF